MERLARISHGGHGLRRVRAMRSARKRPKSVAALRSRSFDAAAARPMIHPVRNARRWTGLADEQEDFSASAMGAATRPSSRPPGRFDDAGAASKRHVDASPALGNGFPFVPGLGPVSGPAPPIVGPGRRPFQSGMVHHALECPARVFGVIRGEAEFRAIDENTRDAVQVRRRDEPPFAMTALRPGIRKQEEQAADAGVGQGFQQNPGVVVVNQDIPDLLGGDGPQQARYAVDVGFAADEQRVRIRARLRRQMLSLSEADFDPDIRIAAQGLSGRPSRERAEIRHRRPKPG